MTQPFIIYSFSLIFIGLIGITLNQANLLTLLLGLEVILLGLNLCFLFSSLINSNVSGQSFALIVLSLAASESALGLGLLIAFFRLRGSISINNSNLLRG